MSAAINETCNTFSLLLFLNSFPVSSLRCKAPRSGHSRGREGTSHWKGMVMVWKPVGRKRNHQGKKQYGDFVFILDSEEI